MSVHTANLTQPPSRTPAIYRHPLTAGFAPAALWVLTSAVSLVGHGSVLLALLALLEAGAGSASSATVLLWSAVTVGSLVMVRWTRRAASARTPGALGYRAVDDPAPPWSYVTLREAAYCLVRGAQILVTAWVLTLPAAQTRIEAAGDLDGVTFGAVVGYVLLMALGARLGMDLISCLQAPRLSRAEVVSAAVTLALVVTEWVVIVSLTSLTTGLGPVAIGAAIYGFVAVIRWGIVVATATPERTPRSDTDRPWRSDRPWTEVIAGSVLTWWSGSATVQDRQRAAWWMRGIIVALIAVLFLIWIT